MGHLLDILCGGYSGWSDLLVLFQLREYVIVVDILAINFVTSLVVG